MVVAVLRLLAHRRLARFRQIADSVGAYLFVTWHMSPVSWRPGSIPIRCPYGCCDLHHSQDPARTAWRIILARANPDIEKKLSSMIFPGTQGGPPDARDPASGGIPRGVTAGVQDLSAAVVQNAPPWRRDDEARGYRLFLARTTDHLFLST